MSNVKCHAAIGRVGRLLAVRLLPGQDVVEGAIFLIREHGIKSGTVQAIGSLGSATVMWLKSMEVSKDKKDSVVFHTMEGPVELGMGFGVFGTDDSGEVNIHFHGLIMDNHGQMRCGNLVPGSAPVLVTVDMTIQEMDGVALVPTLDNVFKHKFLHPTPAVPTK